MRREEGERKGFRWKKWEVRCGRGEKREGEDRGEEMWSRRGREMRG